VSAGDGEGRTGGALGQGPETDDGVEQHQSHRRGPESRGYVHRDRADRRDQLQHVGIDDCDIVYIPTMVATIMPATTPAAASKSLRPSQYVKSTTPIAAK
jgi:hypothetical protein